MHSEETAVGSRITHGNAVIGEAALAVEVEHKQQASLLKGEDLAGFVPQRDVLIGTCLQISTSLRLSSLTVLVAEVVRVHVPVVDVLVQQIPIVPIPHLPSLLPQQTPLSPTVVKGVRIALPREIDPLCPSLPPPARTGVSELVAHEVQVALAAQHLGQQAHEVQHVDALTHHVAPWHQLRHVVVHRRVHQPERQRLVAHQRLVVALVVAHVLLAPSAGHAPRSPPPPVGDRVHDLAHVPVLEPTLLQQPDPLVFASRLPRGLTGDRHVHAVVKPDSAVAQRRGEQRIA